MKTIAVTIDETTLKLLDELTTASPWLRSRSAVVRTAVREFAERERQRDIGVREHEILRKHRKRLARQARALMAEQARPPADFLTSYRTAPPTAEPAAVPSLVDRVDTRTASGRLAAR